MKLTITVFKNANGKYNAKYEHSFGTAERKKNLNSIDDVAAYAVKLMKKEDEAGNIVVK